MNLPENCPVISEALDLLACQQEVSRKLRHFRKTLERCRKCPLNGECEGLKIFNQAIEQAIQEVAEEWGFK